MGQHDKYQQRPSQSGNGVSSELLTPKTDSVEIRMKAVSLCYRPDKSAKQIIDFADELVSYILNGQPPKEVR